MITDFLYLKGANEWKLRVRPVAVGLVYHREESLPFSLIIFKSKKSDHNVPTKKINFIVVNINDLE